MDFYRKYTHFIHGMANKIRLTEHPIIAELIAETLGTAIVIFFGDGAAAQRFLSLFIMGDLFSISLAWGISISIGIMVSGKACSALFNPALTVANAFSGRLRLGLAPAYVVLEIVGAFLGAAVLFAIYQDKIIAYANTYDGGQFLTNTTGGIFVANKVSSIGSPILDQIIITACMAGGILAVSDNRLMPKSSSSIPLIVGMVVYMAVGTYTANISSALNPARDLGPRLFLLVSYWGVGAFTEDNYYFWVPLVMPIVGACIGTLIYDLLIGIHYPPETVIEQMVSEKDNLGVGLGSDNIGNASQPLPRLQA